MKSAEQCISPLNSDVNSGNPIGLTFSAATATNSVRFNANWAFLQGAPDNLEIVTDAQVTRVLFEGKCAVGVEANGTKCESAAFSIAISHFSRILRLNQD
jgi:choline dehydrogenase-like flavoprotein